LLEIGKDVHEAFFVKTEVFSPELEAKTKMFMSQTEALAIPAEVTPRWRPSELSCPRPRQEIGAWL